MAKDLQTIVIDAGHGGAEKIGGSSPNNAVGANGLLEKDLTLDIARRTAAVLKDAAKVLLTRDEDKNLSLAKRAAIAGINKADVFLSIHFNGFRDKTVDGTETFVPPKANPASEKLARNVLDNLVNVTRVSNRGVRRADLGVLKPERHLPQTAVCLAEVAFLSNPQQAKRLEDAVYRQQIAVALSDAVLKSLPSSGAAVSAQSFFDDDEDLNAGYFQPLDYSALDAGGNPIVNIGKSITTAAASDETDVNLVKRRLFELGFDWISSDKKLDKMTIEIIRLFQSIINGHHSISGDGKIEVGKTTHLWLQAANAPRWQTMPAGSQAEGFINFELSDTKDTHDFGTSWMAETIKSAAAHYRDNYLRANTSAALLTINDVSLPHGGNTPDHSGHEAGLACDLQLPRTDGKAGGITYRDSIYDRNAARAVLQALKAQANVTNIYFNDSTLAREGLCQTEASWCAAVKMKCHDNHIHFEIKPPARGAIERDGMFNYHSGGRLYQGSNQDDIDYQTHSLDATCGNPTPIKNYELYKVFKPMLADTKIRHSKDYDFNVFLRWNDIPQATCELDVVVHFHGYNNPDGATIYRVAELSGLDLIDPSGKSQTRRGAPTLCIMPLGKSEPTDARYDRHTFPFFNSDKGLNELINDSLNYLAQYHKLMPGAFKARRLILTAHSGGGAGLASVLNRKNAGTLKLDKDIDEVHLFDATYGGASALRKWAENKLKNDLRLSAAEMPSKGGALRILYRPCGDWNWKYNPKNGSCSTGETETQARQVEEFLNRTIPAAAPARNWYRVERTTVEHNQIPNTFGFQLLANAGKDLTPAPVEAAKIPKKPACCPDFPGCVCRGKPPEPPKPQSLSFNYEEEPDYLAGSEVNYMNY